MGRLVVGTAFTPFQSIFSGVSYTCCTEWYILAELGRYQNDK